MSEIAEPNFNSYPKVADWEKIFFLLQQANEQGFRAGTSKEFYTWLKTQLDLTGLSNTAGLPDAFPAAGATVNFSTPQAWTLLTPKDDGTAATYTINGTAVSVAENTFKLVQWNGSAIIQRVVELPEQDLTDYISTENIEEKRINKFNPLIGQSVENGYIDSVNWVLNSVNGTLRGKVDISNFTSGHVAISGLVLPTVGTSLNYPYMFTDATGADAGHGIISSSTVILIIPVGATTIYFGIRRPEVGNEKDYTNIQVEDSSTVSPFSPYSDAVITKIRDTGISAKQIDEGLIMNEKDEDGYVASKGWVKGRNYGVPVVQSSVSENVQNPTDRLEGKYIQAGSSQSATVNGNLIDLTDAIVYTHTPDVILYTLGGLVWNKKLSLIARFENSAGEKIGFQIVWWADATGAVEEISPTLISVPAGTARVLYPVYRTGQGAIDFSKVMLLKGDRTGDYPTEYIPYAESEEYIESITIGTKTVKIKADSDSPVLETVNSLTVKNSDKVVIAGCSYIEGAGTNIKNKSVVPRVAAMLDLPVLNWGVGGDRLTDITNRILQNTPSNYGTQGIHDIGATYITINNTGNEVLIDKGINSDLYRQALEDAVVSVLSVGAKPLFSTDWFIKNPLLSTVIRQVADKYEAPFHDMGTTGEKILTQAVPAIRWWGTHPDTRGNSYMVKEWADFLSKSISVKKSIKIFRPRASVSDVNELNYDTTGQRLKVLNEIQVGNRSLSESESSYMDRSQDAASYSRATIYSDEYLQLMRNSPLSFSGHAVMQFIVDQIQNESIKIKIKSDTTGLSFYLKNNLKSSDVKPDGKTYYSVVVQVDQATFESWIANTGDIYTSSQILNSSASPVNLLYKGKYYSAETGYIIAFETQSKVTPTTRTYDTAGVINRSSGSGTTALNHNGISSVYSRHSWEFLTSVDEPNGSFDLISSNYVDGVYEIEVSSNHIAYDKIVLAIQSPSFNITDVEVLYSGGIDKFMPEKKWTEKKSGSPLITNPAFDETGYAEWTVSANVSRQQMLALHRDYPSLIGSANSHVVIPLIDGVSDYIKRDISFSAATGYRKGVIKVISRIWPKLFRPDLTEDDYVTHTQEITANSYDLGTLCVGLKGNNIVNILKDTIDIGWAESVFEIDIPPYISSLEMSIFRDGKDTTDYPLHICYVSFEILN